MAVEPLAVGQLSSTVRAARASLGDGPVPVSELVEAILTRHRHDYARGRTADLPVAWPQRGRHAPADEWLAGVHDLLAEPASTELHGRVVVLGLAVLDPRSGRAMLESGLFGALAEELEPPFVSLLSEHGVERLADSPLAAAAAGLLGAALEPARATAVAFHPRGRLLAAADTEGAIRILDTATGVEVERVDLGGAIAAIAYGGDGALLAFGGSDAAVREGDGEPLRLGLTGPVEGLAFSPDATRLATVGPSGLTIWEASGGWSPGPLRPGPARAVAFTPDARMVVTAGDEHVRLWEVDASAPTPIAEREHVGVTGLAVLAGGLTVASVGTDAGLRLWRLPGLEPEAEIDYGPEELHAVTATPDGSRLALAVEDGTVRILDARSRLSLARLPSDGGVRPVRSLAFSPSGRLLATAGDDTRLWDVGLRRTSDVRLSRYAADAARGDDLLGLEADVEAFAQLVAARTVAPPLSIGVFGDWGSGKSFFMRLLRTRVAEISREARESGELQRDVTFYKSIVQIEFNAWHYAEGDLWASLVDHILANLRVHRDEPDDVVRRRQEAIIEHLGIEQAALVRAEQVAEQAHARLHEIDAALRRTAAAQEALRRRLADVSAAEAADVVAPDAVRAEIERALAAVGLGTVGEAIRELDSAADAAQDLLRRRPLLTALVRAPDRDDRLRGAVLVGLAVPAALAVAAIASVFAGDAVATLSGLAAGAAGLVTTGARWVRSQAEWTAARLDEIDAARRRLQEPLRRERERLERKRVLLEERLRRRTEQARAAERARQAQVERVHEVEAELAAATPARLLARFLQDRLDSGDYRERLGTLALVRRDFETIAEYLQSETDKLDGYESLEEEARDADVRINRIVLYVDDLDRCEPKKVVQVLQAVHLLLAFPLFVVVVGVDVRWVARSLALEYPDLLRAADGSAAAPIDYLEKIFQIPFWLDRPTEAASRHMLRGLLAAAVAQVSGAARVEIDAPVVSEGDGTAGEAGGTGGDHRGLSGPAGTAAQARELPDLAPAQLEVTPGELASIESLAPLLSRSPRALKRFVNTYQLIKAGVPDPASFVADGSAEVVMALLALETAAPRSAETVFDALGDAPDADLRRAVGLAAQRRGGEEALTRLAAWLEGAARGGPAARDAATLAEAAERVTQFSFRARS